jgi:hypothetical protein
MADGRVRAAWEHTAHLLWIQAELNRNPKKRTRPYRPMDFNPFAAKRRARRTVTVEQLTEDMMRFVDRRKGRS